MIYFHSESIHIYFPGVIDYLLSIYSLITGVDDYTVRRREISRCNEAQNILYSGYIRSTIIPKIRK